MSSLSLLSIAPLLYAEEMHDLIEEKKLRRGNLNVFVLSIGFGKINDTNEIDIFFKLLSKNINDLKALSRFQLAIECEDHWFGVDCYIKNNQLYLFVLDASVLSGSAELIKKAALDLKPIIFFYRGIPIQYDFEHCSFFTLDHLFRLSNRGQHWDDLINFNFSEPGNITYFDHDSCPNSLAFIFKNIQSFKGFHNLPDSLKKSIINKNHTLEQFITRNSIVENCSGVECKTNRGIIWKEKKYMERVSNFFKPVNYEKNVGSRQGFEIIGGEIGEVIKEVISNKDKSYLKSLINENKILIKDNMGDMLDVAVYYKLKDFLILLIEDNLLRKEFILFSDISSLIKQNPVMFIAIFEHAKNSLTYTDFSKIRDKINLHENDQYKEYFSSFFEEPNSYSHNSLSS